MTPALGAGGIMATSVNFSVVSLGNLADLDTSEGNNTAENATSLVGQTFGGAGTPLVNNFVEFSAVLGGGFFDTYDYETGVSTSYDQATGFFDSHEEFSINGGSPQGFDSTALYNATIVFVDGTSANISAVIFQDVSGNTYWAPEFSANADQATMESQGIRSLTLDSLSSDTFVGLTAIRETWNYAVCFVAGTSIETAEGQISSVEHLSVGDLALTADQGLQELKWVGSQNLSANTLAENPKLYPIRILKGALGEGLPNADLVVSPQHRILVRSKIAKRMFGQDEVLIAAHRLLPLEGIEIAYDFLEVTYIHFLFDQHQIVFANGAETESLFAGPQALKSVSPEALEEIQSIFPEFHLLNQNHKAARLIAEGSKGKQLVRRHQQNQKALVSPRQDNAGSPKKFTACVI